MTMSLWDCFSAYCLVHLRQWQDWSRHLESEYSVARVAWAKQSLPISLASTMKGVVRIKIPNVVPTLAPARVLYAYPADGNNVVVGRVESKASPTIWRMAPRNRRYTGGTLPSELAIFAVAEHTAAWVSGFYKNIDAWGWVGPKTIVPIRINHENLTLCVRNSLLRACEIETPACEIKDRQLPRRQLRWWIPSHHLLS